MFMKGGSELTTWYLPSEDEKVAELEADFKKFKGSMVKEVALLCEWLVEHSILRYSKICPELDKYYIYNPNEGIYNVLSKDLYRKRIYKILSLLGRKVTHKDVSLVSQQMEFLVYVHPDNVIRQTKYICFKNGVFDLDTEDFIHHSPNIFLTSRLNFDYIPSAEPVQWLKFIEEFCGYDQQRVQLLRSWLKLLIHKIPDTQTVLYILGPGGTGKSVVANLATLMVGQEDTLSSSLRSLTSDQFELLNIKDKSLISLSDTEMFSGDISVLKRITGGDLLQGRMKLKQKSFDLYSEALVLIVSNFMLGSLDSSGALDRRLRILFAGQKPKVSKALLYRKGRMGC